MLLSVMLLPKLRYRHVLAPLGLALMLLPAFAEQKGGMPDLSQEEQTCLPTSTANLIIWFGQHGYPKLILPGATEDERELHTLHALMTDTNARYDFGTRTDAVTSGIEKYIRDAGYGCDVEYRGLDFSMLKRPEIVKDYEGEKYRESYRKPAAFTQDWLQDNADPNKGFILLLAYCNFNKGTNEFTDAISAGHAVTLVDAEPDALLIHDPAHEEYAGRKIVTPFPLVGGILRLPGYNVPVAGLLLLSGSNLWAPRGAVPMLTGAVCITMHPQTEGGTVIASAGGGPTPTIGGTNAVAAPSVPSTPAKSSDASWADWLFDLLFKK